MPGLLDLQAFLLEGLVRRQTFFENLAVADDHAQQIIEVVRDAAGKLAHGFHLLRLAQLFFQQFLFRDVPENGDHAFLSGDFDDFGRIKRRAHARRTWSEK